MSWKEHGLWGPLDLALNPSWDRALRVEVVPCPWVLGAITFGDGMISCRLFSPASVPGLVLSISEVFQHSVLT